MEAAVLEQTLRDHPGDPAAWQAYGEVLLERGDARGTLIRLEQRRAHAGPAGRALLAGEIAALVEEHQPGWDAALPPGVTVLARRYGFATKVGVQWSEEAPALIEQALRDRFVTALRIGPPADTGEEPEDFDDVYDDFDADGDPVMWPVEVGAFATLDLSRLVELDLSYLCIGESGAALVASAVGDRLTALDLRYCGIGDAGLAAFAASARCGGLRRLHLQRNTLTAEGVRLLWLFERLVELDLRYNRIGAEGAKALVEAPFIGSLNRLLLYRHDVTDEGVDVLAAAPQLPPVLRSYWRSV